MYVIEAAEPMRLTVKFNIEKEQKQWYFWQQEFTDNVTANGKNPTRNRVRIPCVYADIRQRMQPGDKKK